MAVRALRGIPEDRPEPLVEIGRKPKPPHDPQRPGVRFERARSDVVDGDRPQLGELFLGKGAPGDGVVEGLEPAEVDLVGVARDQGAEGVDAAAAEAADEGVDPARASPGHALHLHVIEGVEVREGDRQRDERLRIRGLGEQHGDELAPRPVGPAQAEHAGEEPVARRAVEQATEGRELVDRAARAEEVQPVGAGRLAHRGRPVGGGAEQPGPRLIGGQPAGGARGRGAAAGALSGEVEIDQRRGVIRVRGGEDADRPARVERRAEALIDELVVDDAQERHLAAARAQARRGLLDQIGVVGEGAGHVLDIVEIARELVEHRVFEQEEDVFLADDVGEIPLEGGERDPAHDRVRRAEGAADRGHEGGALGVADGAEGDAARAPGGPVVDDRAEASAEARRLRHRDAVLPEAEGEHQAQLHRSVPGARQIDHQLGDLGVAEVEPHRGGARSIERVGRQAVPVARDEAQEAHALERVVVHRAGAEPELGGVPDQRRRRLGLPGEIRRGPHAGDAIGEELARLARSLPKGLIDDPGAAFFFPLVPLRGARCEELAHRRGVLGARILGQRGRRRPPGELQRARPIELVVVPHDLLLDPVAGAPRSRLFQAAAATGKGCCSGVSIAAIRSRTSSAWSCAVSDFQEPVAMGSSTSILIGPPSTLSPPSGHTWWTL